MACFSWKFLQTIFLQGKHVTVTSIGRWIADYDDLDMLSHIFLSSKTEKGKKAKCHYHWKSIYLKESDLRKGAFLKKHKKKKNRCPGTCTLCSDHHVSEMRPHGSESPVAGIGHPGLYQGSRFKFRHCRTKSNVTSIIVPRVHRHGITRARQDI